MAALTVLSSRISKALTACAAFRWTRIPARWREKASYWWFVAVPAAREEILTFYDIATAVMDALLGPDHETLLNVTVCVLLVLADMCVKHVIEKGAAVAVLAAPA